MRERIINEIRRLAEAKGGQAPGREAFERATGIARREWHIAIWPTWGEALRAAGFAPNELNTSRDSEDILRHFIDAVRRLGKVPTMVELRIFAKSTPGFPSHTTFSNVFKSKELLVETAREFARGRADFEDVFPLLNQEANRASEKPAEVATSKEREGFVYLIKMGNFYKIGRSDDLDRRMREFRLILPEEQTLQHAIRTDDPAGIEAYWHRRFSDRRANGEWFKLAVGDVAAFKRRKYQ